MVRGWMVLALLAAFRMGAQPTATGWRVVRAGSSPAIEVGAIQRFRPDSVEAWFRFRYTALQPLPADANRLYLTSHFHVAFNCRTGRAWMLEAIMVDEGGTTVDRQDWRGAGMPSSRARPLLLHAACTDSRPPR